MDLRKLKQEQERLASKVLTTDQFEEIKTIAGCDQAFVGDKVISVVVVLDVKTMDVIEKKQAVTETYFPYIPGFLSYKEAPAVIEAFNKLNTKPDILFCDGNGILHPRRFGIASHLGIALDIPTIGVAKNLLTGNNSDGKIIVDKEIMGIEFISREHARPLYVSPGNKISLQSAIELVKKCMKSPHKLPEPLHLAHRFVTKARKKEEKSVEEKLSISEVQKIETTSPSEEQLLATQ